MHTDDCHPSGQKKNTCTTGSSGVGGKRRSYQTIWHGMSPTACLESCIHYFFHLCLLRDINFPRVLIPLIPMFEKDDKKLIQSWTVIYDKSDRNHHNRDLITAAWENRKGDLGRGCISTKQCESQIVDRWFSQSFFLPLVECVCVCVCVCMCSMFRV